MTERLSSSQIRAVSLAEFRAYLNSAGFASRGSWGKFLERFHMESDGRSFDVILPTTNDIADYDSRINDAVRDVATATEASLGEVFARLIVSDHKVFRLRAHPRSHVNSIGFDEGHALLMNAKNLIKSSAVSAFSSYDRRVIKGRSSLAVENYMDRIRLGQSEIGSYIFNILLPKEDGMYAELGNHTNPDSVITTLETGMSLALEMTNDKRVPTFTALEEAGITANFCESLYNMIDWSGEISIELSSFETKRSGIDQSYSFDRKSLSILEKTAMKLAPEEQGKLTKISGTITRLSEPASRRRGSLDLLVKLGGRRRSVRLNFEASDRETVITAFRDKSARLLTVTGLLRTERNGHLVLDEPRNFDASKRGSLL